MKLIIALLLIILVFFMVYGKKQHSRMIMHERDKMHYLKNWGIHQSINWNLQRIMYFADKMELLKKYLKEEKINKIVVYGMGVVGKTFVEQMEKNDIAICYGIDQAKVNTEIEVRKPEQVENDIDIILVTAEIYYQEIYQTLKEKVDVPIVPLSQFLDEVKLTMHMLS